MDAATVSEQTVTLTINVGNQDSFSIYLTEGQQLNLSWSCSAIGDEDDGIGSWYITPDGKQFLHRGGNEYGYQGYQDNFVWRAHGDGFGSFSIIAGDTFEYGGDEYVYEPGYYTIVFGVRDAYFPDGPSFESVTFNVKYFIV